MYDFSTRSTVVYFGDVTETVNTTAVFPRLHILFGPVAAGKSTYGIALATAHRAPLFMLDRWMAKLFGDDERPAAGRLQWYLERRVRCLGVMLEACRNVLELGMDVILEPSLVLASSRRSLFDSIEDWPCEVVVHVVDAPLAVRRSRVEQRNRDKGETFAMKVPLEVFERASAMWEPLDEEECRGRTVNWVSDYAG